MFFTPIGNTIRSNSVKTFFKPLTFIINIVVTFKQLIMMNKFSMVERIFQYLMNTRLAPFSSFTSCNIVVEKFTESYKTISACIKLIKINLKIYSEFLFMTNRFCSLLYFYPYGAALPLKISFLL